MNLNKLIRDKVVTPSQSTKFKTSTGEVLSVDYAKNHATIKIINQYGAGFFELERVPITFHGNGINLTNIYKGDKVIVDFIGGSIASARITGLSYNNYEIFKSNGNHPEQSLSVKNKPVKINKIITQDKLLFEDEESLTDYTNNIDLDKEYQNIVDNIGSYEWEDIGITNPRNKSTIKIKGNGDIEISSNKDSKVTIDNKGNISIFAKDINIESLGDISISTLKNINIKCNKIEKDINYGF